MTGLGKHSLRPLTRLQSAMLETLAALKKPPWPAASWRS